MATTIPEPGLVGKRVFSSIQPLYTQPKPPSPRYALEPKFLVAVFRSVKLNDFRLAAGGNTSLWYDGAELAILCCVALLVSVELEVVLLCSGFSGI
jgi:hypothetical protein